jgi:hypothetical protein
LGVASVSGTLLIPIRPGVALFARERCLCDLLVVLCPNAAGARAAALTEVKKQTLLLFKEK